MGSPNEQFLCRHLACSLADWLGQIVDRQYVPEADMNTPNDERIDYLAHLSDGSCIAIEHTQAVPYNAYLGDQENWLPYESELAKGLEGLNFPGQLIVGLELSWTARVSNRGRRRLFRHIVDFCQANLLDMVDEEHARHRAVCRTESFEEETILFQHFSQRVGRKIEFRLLHDREIADDQRAEKISSQLLNKLPKLGKWKAKGALTVLIIENNDHQLSDEVAICEAVSSTVGALQKPDYIFVATKLSRDWTVSRLLLENSETPDEPRFEILWEWTAERP